MILCPNCNLIKNPILKDNEVSYCSKCKHYVYNQLEKKDVVLREFNVLEIAKIIKIDKNGNNCIK